MIRDDLRLPSPVHIPHDIEVFAKLDVSPFEFFLAGSRYMGCAREDSDWDFITQDSEPVVMHLERLGFKPMLEYASEKGNTVFVMEYVDGDLRVQVQLCRNAEQKRIARDFIKEHMLEEHIKMGSVQRDELWDTLYHVLNMKAQVPDLEPLPF